MCSQSDQALKYLMKVKKMFKIWLSYKVRKFRKFCQNRFVVYLMRPAGCFFMFLEWTYLTYVRSSKPSHLICFAFPRELNCKNFPDRVRARFVSNSPK